jgi:hypothetical protein
MGLDSNSSGSNDNKNGVRFQDYLNSNQPESIIYYLNNTIRPARCCGKASSRYNSRTTMAEHCS